MATLDVPAAETCQILDSAPGSGSCAAPAPARRPCNTGRKFVCRCLRVSEEDVREVVDAGAVEDLTDLMAYTGAGTGCMACRRAIRTLLEGCRQSSGCSPTCVER